MKITIFTLVFCSLLFFQCTSAPRYRSQTAPGKHKEKQTQSVFNVKKDSNDPKTTLLIKGRKHSAIFNSSYYGKDFHGRKTANGEVFDMYGYTAAHKTLPLGTFLKVTYIKTGKSIIVKVNDRGPFIKGRDLDLSYGAAKKIGLLNDGVGKVKVAVVKWAEE